MKRVKLKLIFWLLPVFLFNGPVSVNECPILSLCDVYLIHAHNVEYLDSLSAYLSILRLLLHFAIIFSLFGYLIGQHEVFGQIRGLLFLVYILLSD